MSYNCKASFYLTYINFCLYGLMTLVVLWNNWDKYGCGILSLILAPLISMLFTAYFVSYEWWMQGHRITCIAFGSFNEMITRDIEQALLFLIQSIFIFTMLKILRKITAPNKEEGVRAYQDVTFKMIIFIVLFCIETIIVFALKYLIFRRPTFDDQKRKVTWLEISLIVFCAFMMIFTIILVAVFYKVVVIYKQ
jgi:MFS family permease